MIPPPLYPENSTSNRYLDNSLLAQVSYDHYLSSQKLWEKLGYVTSHLTDEETTHRKLGNLSTYFRSGHISAARFKSFDDDSDGGGNDA